MEIKQLLVETANAAQLRFKGKPLRVWYVMLEENSWRAIVINTESKAKMATGQIRASASTSLLALKHQLEGAIRKTS
jgi:hypothetical protein